MRKTTLCKLIAGICVVLFLIVPCSQTWAQSQPVKFKAVTFLPKGNPTAASFGRMVDAFNEQFKGKASIEWVGGPEVIPETQLHESVRSGMIDMVATSSAFYKAILPVSDATMFSNKTHAEIEASGFNAMFRDLHTKIGVVYIGETGFGQNFYLYTKFPLKSPKDVAGKKIRVFPAITPFVTALKAAPVNMVMPDIYTAMERGVVDGFVMATIGFVQSFAWHEVTKYMVMHGFYRGSVAVLANPKRWDQLPKGLQTEIIEWKAKVWDPKEDKYYTTFAQGQTKLVLEKGVKPVEFEPEDAKAFLKLAYDSAWAKMAERSPDLAPKIKAMLVK
jgi:TRAP-type C4-dicarboxylate transport system substrate-binding protein